MYRDRMTRQRWHLVQDIGLAALVGMVGLAEVWVPFESAGDGGSSVLSSIGIIVCAVLLGFRRTAPLVLVGLPLTWVTLGFVGGGDVQVLFFGQLVPICLALYSGARHTDGRTMGIVCGSIAAGVVIAQLTVPELGRLSELLFDWGVLLGVFGIGRGLRGAERRAIDAAVRATEAQAQVRETALRAVAEERARIARELHDILGHSVSIMVVQAGAAAQAVEDDPAFVRRALEAIRETGSQSLEEVRRVVALLREDDDATLAPQPGLAQVPELVAQARADGIRVDFAELGDPAGLSAGQELSVYRIVQEALTNIRKHAPGARARVELRYEQGAAEVVVTDDGDARPVVAAGGHGLVGMRERVGIYGGTLAAGPDAGGGWRVHATVGDVR